MNRKAGFTLLELSIVLVIIGLIVGGVLVGKDLITAAKLQKVIREAEGFQNAAATFKLKYNGLPGDLSGATAFFGTATWNPGTGHGDGVIIAITEGADAWRQLSLANLIGAGNMTGYESCPSHPTTNTCAGSIGSTQVKSSYSDTSGWSIGVSGKTNKNAILLGSPRSYEAWSDNATLTSLGAYNIDNKVDDGMPYSGSVRNEKGWSGYNFTGDPLRNTYRCTDADDSVSTKNSGADPAEYFHVDGDSACSLSFPLGV